MDEIRINRRELLNLNQYKITDFKEYPFSGELNFHESNIIYHAPEHQTDIGCKIDFIEGDKIVKVGFNISDEPFDVNTALSKEADLTNQM